jgi:phosphoglycerate dehydrogenase-like enzyme
MAVLGLGTIGERIARVAAAFGMRVVGTKRHPAGYRGTAERVFLPGGTVEACRMADVVVIALPGGPETAGIVGREALAALDDGWLVNVGRGSVVDEEALVEALTAGRLRGAGLDVVAVEPLPEDSPLWDLPGIVMSPHCAGVSPRYAERLAEITAANLLALRGEGPWVNRIV